MKRIKQWTAFVLSLAMMAGSVSLTAKAAETDSAAFFSETETESETAFQTEETEAETASEPESSETETASETEGSETETASETAETEEDLLLEAPLSGTFGSDRLTWALTGTKANATLTIGGKGTWELCDDDAEDEEYNPWTADAYNSYSIKTVVLSEGITEVYGAYDLGGPLAQTLKLPASLTKISPSFAYMWYELNTITVASGNSTYSAYDGALYNKGRTELVYCPRAKKSIRFPSALKVIGKNAFSSTEMTSLNLPEGVTTISERAFAYAHFKNLYLPASVKQADDCAFTYSCIRSYSLAEGHKVLETTGGALYLKSPKTLLRAAYDDFMDMPFFVSTGTVKIAEGALDGYSSISDLYIPKSVKTIDSRLSDPEEIFYEGTEANWQKISFGWSQYKADHYNFLFLQGLTVSPAAKNMKSGESFSLKISAKSPADADPIGYTYSSSNESVVSVSKDGKVTARGGGKAVITVTAQNNNVSASCQVTVNKASTVKVVNVNYPAEVYPENVDAHNYRYPYREFCAETPHSYITKSGSYLMTVNGRDGIGAESAVVAVDYYDSKGNYVKGKVITGLLNLFGAFYESADHYYLVVGQENYEEDPQKETIRVVKFDKNWKYLGETGIYDCDVVRPFDAGACRLAMMGDHLILHMAREMYARSGINHQSDIGFVIDTREMVCIQDMSMECSHSFNEFIETDGSRVVILNHGDVGESRGVYLSVYEDYMEGYTSDDHLLMGASEVTDPNDSLAYNITGITEGAFKVSSSSYLIAGSGYDQETQKTPYNIFLISMNKASGKTQTSWLTTAKTSGESVGNPYLVDLGDDTFLIMWTLRSNNTKLYYQRVAADGSLMGSRYTMTAALSDCEPRLIDGIVRWYVLTEVDDKANEKELAYDQAFYWIDAVSLSKTGSSKGVRKPYDRVAGNDRYGTSTAIADALLAAKGVTKFDTVIVASGASYADALAGSYLAAKKGAPILLCNKSNVKAATANVKKYLKSGGTVYLLGGTLAVPDSIRNELGGYTVRRLGGNTRYDTNISILKEAGISSGAELLVCSGTNFADALSAAAAGRPILLVDKSLSGTQKKYLESVKERLGKIYLIGGSFAVSDGAASSLAAYRSTERVNGANRFATSEAVARKFFGSTVKAVVLAYGMNFPDGLCGGPLACAAGGPLLLMDTKNYRLAGTYISSRRPADLYVLGGQYVIPEYTMEYVID